MLAGVTGDLSLVFGASMTSGLLYSVITMPFETTKNRMAFQRPDPTTGILPYRSSPRHPPLPVLPKSMSLKYEPASEAGRSCRP